MARDDPEHYKTVDLSTLQGAGKKIVIYVKDHDTSGPIARAVKVAHELKARGADVTLMVRQEVADNKMLDSDLKVVPYKLKTSWQPEMKSGARQVKRLRPDILITDEYPFVNQQHAAEWEQVIDKARKTNPHTRVIGMTCDIPIYPKTVEAANMAKRSARVDQILVTGDPSIVDFDNHVEPGPAAESVQAKRKYVGFMEEAPKDDALSVARPRNDIVVYLGGHALDHQQEYISLLANIPFMSEALQQAHWHIIMPAIQHMMTTSSVNTMLENLPETVRQNISLEEAGPDSEFTAKLQNADMVVVGGGQTAIKTVQALKLPTIIVPTKNPEQRYRAKYFSEGTPDRVAQLLVPYTVEKKSKTRDRLMYEKAHGIVDTRQWPEKRLDWVQTDPASIEMRETFDRIYAQRGRPQPTNKIMLDGAQRIASEILAPQVAEQNL